MLKVIRSLLIVLYNKRNTLFSERYVRAVQDGEEFQYEEVPVEDFYDDGILIVFLLNSLFISYTFFEDKEDTLDALIRSVKDQQRESQVVTTSVCINFN